MKKFFAEHTRYVAGDEEEKKEAELFLNLWKKFLIKRLQRDSFDVKLIDEQWIHRDAIYDSALCRNETLALKICLELELKGDLEKTWM